MDMRQNIETLLGDRIVCLNSISVLKILKIIIEAVDHLGIQSAKVQRLRTPITSCSLLASSNHRLYFMSSRNLAIGILRVGEKHLYLQRADGKFIEMDILCVLDFYIDESCQRQGFGQTLFQYMLEQEKIRAYQLAYDRPSQKLLAFLKRHFSLKDFVPQYTNFVVFKDICH